MQIEQDSGSRTRRSSHIAVIDGSEFGAGAVLPPCEETRQRYYLSRSADACPSFSKWRVACTS
jgi:hypothetical protein